MRLRWPWRRRPQRSWFLADGTGRPWGPCHTEADRDTQAEQLRWVADWNQRAWARLQERHPEWFA